jgi:hypothetical protein
MNQTTITFLPPAELSIHPEKKLIPDDWGNQDPRYIALVEDIRERGIDQPLLVDGENRVLEGRRRLRAAKQLQLAQVPVIVREAGDVYGIIVNGLVQRGHYTKSQLAYLTYPLMDKLFAESKGRRLKNLRKGQQTPESTLPVLSGKTVDEYSHQIGVSRVLFFQAQEVHRVFAKDTAKYDFQEDDGPIQHLTLKEHFQPRILDPEKPCGLGACLAGIAGMKATKGKGKKNPAQLELFTEGFDTLTKRFTYWNKFDQEDKAKCKAVIVNAVAAMPQDLCEEFEAALKARKKAQNKREE